MTKKLFLNIKNFLQKILILNIRLYQIILSPLLGSQKCRYYPTCSNYAISALKEKGIFIGLFMTICRIMRCHPWSKGGYDPVSKKE